MRTTPQQEWIEYAANAQVREHACPDEVSLLTASHSYLHVIPFAAHVALYLAAPPLLTLASLGIVCRDGYGEKSVQMEHILKVSNT